MFTGSVRTYFYLVLVLIGAEAASWLTWRWHLDPWIFWALITGFIGISWKRPLWIIWIGLAELIIGGKGYLWSVDVGATTVSIRMALFVVTAGTALRFFRFRELRQTWWWRPVGALFIWISIMSLVGLWRNFGWSNTWLDVNGFVYFLTVFFWWSILRGHKDWLATALSVILAGVTVIGLKSWLLTLLFAHQPSDIRSIYLWIRQTGVGEVTLVKAPVHRVFFQSHLYAAIGFIVTWAAFLWRQAPRWWLWPMLAAGLGLYSSLSRSLWLGTAVALVLLAVLFLRRFGWRQLYRWLMFVPIALVVGLLISWAYQWPYVIPPVGESGVNIVRERFSASGAVAAADARRNQFGPLRAAIQDQPISGHGFGKTLTYFSTDPRVRGWRTTAAFELGYLDLWLKIGIIGLGLLAWLCWRLVVALRPTPWAVAFGAGLTVVLVTHLTTPYLNHPLGLGWLAFLICYVGQEQA